MTVWTSLQRSLQPLRPFRWLAALLGIALAIAIVTTSAADEPCEYHPAAYEGLDLASLEGELTGTGLLGRIHGAAADSNLYVLSVREPTNFFASTEFSLIPESTDTATALTQLSRHDLVCIQGNLIPNPSPQPHATVTSLQTLETYDALDDYAPYQHEANIPSELGDRGSFLGKVHAIGANGTILITEYKDGVIPIFVREGLADFDLYRGDIVRIAYRKQTRPDRPPHLLLDTDTDTPLEVVSAIADWHDRTMTLSGTLVKFPRSPQITLDVYAIEVETEGVKRYFTLVNFEDVDKFQEILDKLANIWDANADTAVAGRNLLREPNVTVSASGRINIISPRQANPQILLNSADDVEIL